MPKNIVICCDGTGAEPGWFPSNVIKLFRHVVRDSDSQIAFYEPGVGTSFSFGGLPIVKHLSIGLDMAFGITLGGNVQEAYYFLMDHYRVGDRVFLFGFSRGAFTVRALSRLVYKCGLLDIGCKRLMPYAIKYYHEHHSDGIEMDFKRTYCRPCKLHFIGLWDTVGSLGLTARRWNLRDFELNPDVGFAYQAVAIDEERRKFPVVLWDEYNPQPDQVIEQVWFSGVHSDIGGGYEHSGLSDITLAWMLEKAKQQGLLTIEREDINPDPLGKMHRSRIGPWRLWKPAKRTIPEGAFIHKSVVDRISGGPGYRPQLPTDYKVVE